MNQGHPFLGAHNSADPRSGYTLNPDPLTPQPSAGGVKSPMSAPAAPGVADCMAGFGALVERGGMGGAR